MRSDCGENGLELVAIVLVDVAGEFAGARVFAALVGGHGEDVLAIAELGQAFHKKVIQLLRGEIGIDASGGAIKAHADNSTFFNPGASRRMIASAVRYALAAMI